MKKTNVPNVKGVPIDRARSMIEESNLKVGTVAQEENSQAAGTVTAQSPAAGTEVDEGTAVRLTVSEGSKSAPAKGKDTKNNNSKSSEKPPSARRIQAEKTE